MTSSYLSGFRTALQRWPLALILFVASYVFGFGFSAGTWSWLSSALDKSLATRTLLTDLDMNVFVDLFAHHGDSLWMLLVGGGLLAVVAWLLGVWLNAITIVAVGEELALSAAAHRALDVYARFLRLGVIALAADTLVVIVAVVVGRWLTRWTADSPSEMTFYAIVGASALVVGVLMLWLTAVHDHARIHCAATGTGAVPAYLWALRFVVSGERRAVPLLALLFVTGGAGWAVYQMVGILIATNWIPGVVVSLVWGQLLMLYRMFLRVWSLAAETELQSVNEDTGT